MDVTNANFKPCPVCNGAGKVVVGYSVICMAIVEKVEKCPECIGKGSLKRSGSLEEQA